MLLILILLTIATLYVWLKWRYTYWQRMGFPYHKSPIPFGVLDKVRRQERSLGTAIHDVYKKSEEKVLGIFLLLRPALLVRDAELARKILSSEFKHFHDRGIYVDEDNDPMSATLLNLRGRDWKDMRVTLAPSFTSGKLKGIFGTIEDIADRMIAHLNSVVSDEGSTLINMKDITSRYAIDIVASVIYGLDVNSFKEPKNDFFKVSKMFNAPTLTSIVHRTCEFLYPDFLKIMVRCGFKDNAAVIINNMVRQTIEYREKYSVQRKDMLQLLLQVRNNGKVNNDENLWEAVDAPNSKKSLSIDKIAAQLYLFYVAGFETTGSSIAYTIFELAKNASILSRVQHEINEVVDRYGGLTYEAIWDMQYLKLCVMETIRKYPALPILNRECTMDFEIPGTDKVIKRGTPIIISLLGIHRDEQYFPKPLSYEPERFSKGNLTSNANAYMPFGEGPRQCIAQRMGLMNVLLAIVKILMNFDIESNMDQPEINFKTYGVVLLPKGGITALLSKK